MLGPGLIILTAVALESLHDHFLLEWKLGRSDGRAWHRVDAALWALLYGALGYYALGAGWSGALAGALVGGALRLTLFAVLLNAWAGRAFDYVGTTDDLDRMLGRLGRAGALALRVGLLAGALAAASVLT